jgi:hypothetical protein
MKALTKRMVALAGVLALGLSLARAQSDGALLDALVKKGVLSDQEAEDIRASEAQDYATTAAGKIQLSDSISKIKLYGDVRYRWDYAKETPQVVNAPGLAAGAAQSRDNTNERSRFRLQVGTDITFTDNFTGGFELETSANNDSANQTFGNAYAKYAINVGKAYLQWKPYNWVTLLGGKFNNPLYTTDLRWDPDIYPEGGAEVFNWTFPVDFGGSSAPASTDPKAIAPVAEPSEQSFSIGLTAFQGIYADNIESGANVTAPAGGFLNPRTDVWQFVEEVPIQFNFNKTTFIKEVPGFDTYTSGGSSVATGSVGSSGGGSVNWVGPAIADDLAIFTAPGEFDWKSWDIPFKVYWDFALNTEGKARVQNILLGNTQAGVGGAAAVQPTLNGNRALGDNVAWLAGLQVGQNKKKGDWSIKGDFRQTGLGAVDPNENDSDFGDSFLNQQGIKIQSVYNFTDFLTGSLTFFDTWAYKSNLLNGSPSENPAGLPLAGGGGYTVSGNTGTPTATNLVQTHDTQRVEVDLMWKF